MPKMLPPATRERHKYLLRIKNYRGPIRGARVTCATKRTIEMARRGISPADVARAYVQLKQQGREPSLRNLRLQMGRGGYSTIAAHLKKLSFVPDGELRARRQRDRPGSSSQDLQLCQTTTGPL